VSWLELFFELAFCNRTFLPVFFATVFLQSQSHAVFATFFWDHTALRVQSHCDKVAITHMIGLANVFFAITAHQ
jgi:hypothetical protein